MHLHLKKRSRQAPQLTQRAACQVWEDFKPELLSQECCTLWCCSPIHAAPSFPPSGPDFTLNSHQARTFFRGLWLSDLEQPPWWGWGLLPQPRGLGRCKVPPPCPVLRIPSCVHTWPGGSATGNREGTVWEVTAGGAARGCFSRPLHKEA